MQRTLARSALLAAVTTALATVVAVSTAAAAPAPTLAAWTCSTNYFDNLSFTGGASAARAGTREPSA
jgi:hypothetical protein